LDQLPWRAGEASSIEKSFLSIQDKGLASGADSKGGLSQKSTDS